MLRIFLFILLYSVPFAVTAVTVTQTYTNNTNADVDPNSSSPVFRDIIVPVGDFPVGATITDVNVQIRFDKRDEGGANDGVCRRHQGGDVFNNEIGFTLTSPDGTVVDLVTANSGYYSGNVRPGFVVVNYDDEGAIFTGTTPTRGTFQPEGALSDFDNSDTIAGTWRLTLSDIDGGDPLCFRRVRVIIEASNDADIAVSKTSAPTTYTPGGTMVYTLVISNSGPAGVNNVVINDPLPAGVSSASWTCAAAGGANCDTFSATGGINNVTVDIPPGDSVTFTLTVTWSDNPADY